MDLQDGSGSETSEQSLQKLQSETDILAVTGVFCFFLLDNAMGYETECDAIWHTSYLSREPRVYSCKFFLAGVNYYRFNAKKLAFLTDFTRKSGVFHRFNAKNWRFSV